jgi:acyl carrier protein
VVDQEILKEVIQVLKTNRCPLETINAETRIEELELDSVELTRVLMDLEDRFSIIVPDQTWVKWKTIGEVIQYISKYKEEFGGINLTEL